MHCSYLLDESTAGPANTTDVLSNPRRPFVRRPYETKSDSRPARDMWSKVLTEDRKGREDILRCLTYPDSSVVDYGYTARNQVASIIADGPPPLATFTYDLAGNRLTKALDYRSHGWLGKDSAKADPMRRDEWERSESKRRHGNFRLR